MTKRNKLSIEEQIAALDKHKTPSRDLWTGIEYGISNNQDMARAKPTTKPFLAIAASLVVAVLLAFFSFESGRIESGEALVAQLAKQHNAQKESLLISLAGQPTTTQNWQQQLDELDEAAAAIKKALENEPNNAALLKMLQRVYEQQIALIERVHAPAWQQI